MRKIANTPVKMRLNAFVIGEFVNALYPNVSGSDRTQAENDVAISLLDADELHGYIGKLAKSIEAEINKQRGPSPIAARVAAAFVQSKRV